MRIFQAFTCYIRLFKRKVKNNLIYKYGTFWQLTPAFEQSNRTCCKQWMVAWNGSDFAHMFTRWKGALVVCLLVIILYLYIYIFICSFIWTNVCSHYLGFLEPSVFKSGSTFEFWRREESSKTRVTIIMIKGSLEPSDQVGHLLNSFELYGGKFLPPLVR